MKNNNDTNKLNREAQLYVSGKKTCKLFHRTMYCSMHFLYFFAKELQNCEIVSPENCLIVLSIIWLLRCIRS